ncbi:putative metallophosphoesterase domain-containing protein [Aspergillus steynii IBT 23096]|uniref:Putative metallophosphoesterase domain-containing protein n=1 Tax=Aspergillus steynii IBT 23096 TaxID=1392250 RepID=A0A2I2G6H9_9EURO|nr:putative metallophosphoesterase domain-containing protein [Aspergillus steynii IBT 23096]PLB48485.1 putative metallophosphoesterase domain-containing protein [Aspergillus steynii IBT 23096]
MHSTPAVRTKFLIISDTHACTPFLEHLSTEPVDVAIHCGNLTTNSMLEEFKSSIDLLSQINAPLKLVIAGDHDFTLDTPTYDGALQDLENTPEPVDPDFMAQVYGDLGDARSLFENATDNGIMLLDQSTHHFVLGNGASLTVYASPYTPCLPPGTGGFQYPRREGHIFDIPRVDIVMTHGPPKGVMDYTLSKERAGCADLFAAVARARPRMHCFGHVREQWGAKLVSWRKGSRALEPCYLGDVDHEKSVIIERLATLDTEGYGEYEKFFWTSHCTGDPYPLEWGRQTLFVNAAVEGRDGRVQPAWLVEIELSRAF